jgi:hypothetical protein
LFLCVFIPLSHCFWQLTHNACRISARGSQLG